MQPLYDLKKAGKLEPKFYEMKESVNHMFSVPRDNAVGTNDFNNAITLIRFEKDRVVYDEIARDFLKYVSGGQLSFLPVFDRDVIGYGQTRGFLMFDLKTTEFIDHRICYSIEETIKRVVVANATKRHFIFGIKQYDKNSNDHNDYVYLLRLMDLSGKEPVLIKEKQKPATVKWFAAYDKIFLYDKKIAAYTKDLEPSHHPLVNAYNNKVDSSAWRIYAHPFLPFAVIAVKAKAYLLAWSEEQNCNYLKIFDEKAIYYDFSPDGNWVVFQNKFMGDATFYLMPVSEKYPHYLGSPILLHKGNFLATCWTTNPISFIGSDGDLYRWELTNKAYPQAGDKDLHDYIVEKDLEKLGAEKE